MPGTQETEGIAAERAGNLRGVRTRDECINAELTTLYREQKVAESSGSLNISLQMMMECATLRKRHHVEAPSSATPQSKGTVPRQVQGEADAMPASSIRLPTTDTRVVSGGWAGGKVALVLKHAKTPGDVAVTSSWYCFTVEALVVRNKPDVRKDAVGCRDQKGVKNGHLGGGTWRDSGRRCAVEISRCLIYNRASEEGDDALLESTGETGVD